MCEPPTKKRPRLESTCTRSVSENVLRLSEWTCRYLNVPEILCQTLNPDTNFLKADEQKEIWKLCGDQSQPSKFLSGRVVSYLQAREISERDDATRKFVACIIKANEERGHLELAKIFQQKLGSEEWQKIQYVVELSESPVPSPYTTPQHSPAAPERPMKLISLQGQVVEQRFLTVERDLWLSFSTGDYDQVQSLVMCVQENSKFNVDCNVVALWFQSLVKMH